MTVHLILGDCLPAMREMPDDAFDLAIVDPPYGGGCNAAFGGRFERYQVWTDRRNVGGEVPATRERERFEELPRSRFGGHFDRYDIPANENTGDIRHWDVAPPREYFEELFRVSRNQVIWGGNYFALPPTRCFLVWRKLTISDGFSMAMAEYAWTSFNANALVYEAAPQGKANDPRFHPTQKPVALYRWVLSKFAKPGDKVLDTHAGSGSCLIACLEHGYDCTGYEIDPGYHAQAQARIEKASRQGRLL